jgi:hypothetical protein
MGMNGNLLSNKPSEMRIVCADESETIAFWHPENSGPLNKIYKYKDANGIELSNGLIATAKTFESSIHVIGVSPLNLSKLDPPIATPANWQSLEIYYASDTENPLVIYRNRNCCRKFRIWFLNKFGVYDQLTVFDEIETYSVSSTQFSTSRKVVSSTEIDRKEFYNNRINALGRNVREAIVQNYPPSAENWLRELFISPSVYIQYEPTFSDPSITTNQYIPVVVRDGDMKLVDTIDDTKLVVSFKLEYSNIDISQTN